MTVAARATTCPYCGVGCGVRVSIQGAGSAEIAGDQTHPASFGRLCSKGFALGETVGGAGRLGHPLVAGARASWDAALDLVAERFSQTICRYGPDAVAFYVSGQLLTEDYYVANKLMKGFIGSGNIDTNSRLCMSSAVAGHKRAFGADVVPGCYEDWELADLVVLVGSNTAWCHPVLYQRLLAARAKRGTKIVIIDPRRTATCDEADLHIPLKSGSDVRLFNGLLAQLERRGVLDPAFIARHTSGFETALSAAREDDFSIAAIAADCEVDEHAIETFFDWFARTGRTVTAFSQGVNQSSQGVDKVNAIINCHLATGRIGLPGATPFSITGQPNAMGGREVGGLANQLAAHMDFGSAADHARLAEFWGTRNLATSAGLSAVDMFRAVADGRIKAVWIMATNPAVSLPDAEVVRSALARCDFVAVSDCVQHTDTTGFAHVLLPAVAWGEKDGTVTNSERRISRQRAFMDAFGEAKPDWWIICEVARRMGFGSAFSYGGPADIFREHAALSALDNGGRRAFDIGGLAALGDEEYDVLQPVQWPIPKRGGAGTRRLFADSDFFTEDGRGRFVPVRAMPPKSALTPEFPFVLNTGRIRDQWHTMTRTGSVPRLASHISEPFVQIHPSDARALDLDDGSLARIETPLGRGVYRVAVTGEQKRGNLFVPIHWSDRNTAQGATGRLVNSHVDPLSGQPEFKHTPARIAPLRPAWRGFLLCREAVAPPDVEYWVARHVEGGLLYELAGTGEGGMPTLEMLAGEGDAAAERIEIVNAKRMDYRIARLRDERLVDCLILTRSGRLPPREWLASLLSAPRISEKDRASLLAGRPMEGVADCGPLVCACFGIALSRLLAAIKEDELTDVDAVGRRLRAGTNCGSCRPEIRAIMNRALAEEAA